MIHTNPNQDESKLTRKNLLLRSIEFYTKQAYRSTIELQELIADETDTNDTTPLVIKGQGEYTAEIKPN